MTDLRAWDGGSIPKIGNAIRDVDVWHTVGSSWEQVVAWRQRQAQDGRGSTPWLTTFEA